MTITFVSNSSPVATSTTATPSYPTGLASGDTIILAVSSDSSSIGQPASAPASGWTQRGTVQTGGGTSVAMWTATSAGTESGTVSVPITSGTKGAALMAAYRPGAGNSISVVRSQGSDTDSSSTAISVTGGQSLTSAANDLIVFFGLVAAASGTFSAGVSAATITQATMGTYTARISARTGTNTLFYIIADRPVTTGATAAPAFTATAAGANASGAGFFLKLHEVTAVVANVGDQSGLEPWATVSATATASGGSGSGYTYSWRIVSDPSGQAALSGSATPTASFTGPGTLAGVTVTLGVTATDGASTVSTEDQANFVIQAVTERAVVGGVEVPLRIRSVA